MITRFGYTARAAQRICKVQSKGGIIGSGSQPALHDRNCFRIAFFVAEQYAEIIQRLSGFSKLERLSERNFGFILSFPHKQHSAEVGITFGELRRQLRLNAVFLDCLSKAGFSDKKGSEVAVRSKVVGRKLTRSSQCLYRLFTTAGVIQSGSHLTPHV